MFSRSGFAIHQRSGTVCQFLILPVHTRTGYIKRDFSIPCTFDVKGNFSKIHVCFFPNSHAGLNKIGCVLRPFIFTKYFIAVFPCFGLSYLIACNPWGPWLWGLCLLYLVVLSRSLFLTIFWCPSGFCLVFYRALFALTSSLHNQQQRDRPATGAAWSIDSAPPWGRSDTPAHSVPTLPSWSGTKHGHPCIDQRRQDGQEPPWATPASGA